jgi:hypothetical protein
MMPFLINLLHKLNIYHVEMPFNILLISFLKGPARNLGTHNPWNPGGVVGTAGPKILGLRTAVVH